MSFKAKKIVFDVRHTISALLKPGFLKMTIPRNKIRGRRAAKKEVNTIRTSKKYDEYRIKFITNGCIFSLSKRFSRKV